MSEWAIMQGRFLFDRTNRPDQAFGRANSTTPSNENTLRMVYTPPEEWQGLSCTCSFKLSHFSLQTDGSGWPVLTEGRCLKTLRLQPDLILEISTLIFTNKIEREKNKSMLKLEMFLTSEPTYGIFFSDVSNHA